MVWICHQKRPNIWLTWLHLHFLFIIFLTKIKCKWDSGVFDNIYQSAAGPVRQRQNILINFSTFGMSTKLNAWLQLYHSANVFCKMKKFWGQDAIMGSRKNFKELFCVFRGSVVCACYWYYERQLKTVYLQCVFDQTTGSRQKIFFKAKSWYE